jgi:hypothetical protein
LSQLEANSVFLYTTECLKTVNNSDSAAYAVYANASVHRLLRLEASMMLGHGSVGDFVGTVDAPTNVVRRA